MPTFELKTHPPSFSAFVECHYQLVSFSSSFRARLILYFCLCSPLVFSRHFRVLRTLVQVGPHALVPRRFTQNTLPQFLQRLRRSAGIPPNAASNRSGSKTTRLLTI